jgi:fucose 4-O-acetylase-like acetyltransferase
LFSKGWAPVERLPEAAVRDGFLDRLKGFAILSVVLRAAFQATQHFGNYWPFRFVYAFHMPMFIFVSGMTAAFVFDQHIFHRQTAAPLDMSVFRSNLRKKAPRLLIPFPTWAAVS